MPLLWGPYEIGDRVRWISQPSSTGTVVSGPFCSLESGELQQQVLWDGSGKVTAWSPNFYPPIDYPTEDLPDFLPLGRHGVYVKLFGMIIREVFVTDVRIGGKKLLDLL